VVDPHGRLCRARDLRHQRDPQCGWTLSRGYHDANWGPLEDLPKAGSRRRTNQSERPPPPAPIVL
jgi:hypothetical protein